MAKKIFILRTHSIVAKEGATLCFDCDNDVVIPFPILDELEDLSHKYTAKGRNAKIFLDYLSSFTIKDLISEDGVMQKNGSRLRLIKEDSSIKIPLTGLNSVDMKCLQIAKKLQENNPKTPVILVTKNSALRIKANSIKIKAQDFKDELFPALNEQYTGRIECTTSKQKLDLFFKNGYMNIKDIYHYNNFEWMPNVFLTIKEANSCSDVSAIARYDAERKLIVKLNYSDYHPYGITPKNVGQKMMLEALLENPLKAPLVIIKGGAGTGKTYHSLAVALDKTIEQEKIYSQILVSSPIQTVGQEEIGFLPGDIKDKYNPHLGGLLDNLRQLLGASRKNQKSNEKYNNVTEQYILEMANVHVQPIGFLRGRTIVDTYYIIDETQNIDPDDIKSIVSRAGEGSKFVFLGDPTQIDNPSLNERYNGLVYLSEKMKDNPLAWQITLADNESVRSILAKLAAQIL